MKTTVVTEEEIEEIANALRELSNEISNASHEYDLNDKDEQKKLIDALEQSETHASYVLFDIQTIQERFVPDGDEESDQSDERSSAQDQRRLVGASKHALLAALNSLDSVRGHDSTSPLDNNKTEVPISQAELYTIRSLLKGTIELHGADLSSNYIRLALSELLKILREVYEKLVSLAAVAITGAIVFALTKLFEDAIGALETLLKSLLFITV